MSKKKYYVDKQPFIFISYAHNNHKIVNSYINELHSLNYNLWYDESINPMDEWNDKLQGKIESATCLIVFVSEESATSKWVQRELHYASGKNKKIIPVLISETDSLDDLEFNMGHIQCVELLGTRPSDGVKHIVSHIPKETQIDKELFSTDNEGYCNIKRQPPQKTVFVTLKNGEKRRLLPEKGASYRKNEFGGYTVKFNKTGDEYKFRPEKLEVFICKEEIDAKQYKFKVKGKRKEPIKVFQYKSTNRSALIWYFMYKEGKFDQFVNASDLEMENSVLSRPEVNNIYDYLKRLASISNLGVDEDSDEKGIDKKSILMNNYKKVNFLSEEVALSSYLKAHEVRNILDKTYIPIYPFGYNESQCKAVQNALTSQISVIEGPPGTGKTQTILNIIANILMQGKTVLVVSNNNSATQNIQQKLSDKKYQLDFLIASLGKSDNKTAFINNQPAYPKEMEKWQSDQKRDDIISDISLLSTGVQKLFVDQREHAIRKQEMSALEAEYRHFCVYHTEAVDLADGLRIRNGVVAEKILDFVFKCRNSSIVDDRISLWLRIVGAILKGIGTLDFYKTSAAMVIDILCSKYYKLRLSELQKEISELEVRIDLSKGLIEEVTGKSLKLLKDVVCHKYKSTTERKKYSEDDLWRQGSTVLEEYPIILSTTFSSITSLTDENGHAPVIYDYVIMDEASQVDISTGALALACARNAVIVGDTQQLPNIVEDEKKAIQIFSEYQIDAGYIGVNSFLKSVNEVLPSVPRQLLREHYRCHPQIINYCNQKFYNGELIVMSEDDGEEGVISVYETLEGNHVRGKVNRREIDVIYKEVLPSTTKKYSSIGIITPYRDQADELSSFINNDNIECDTVHKFQGREKDAIIISTVDDRRQFVNRKDIINVAISRAKKHLDVVVSSGASKKNTNIGELVKYAEYNGAEIVKSKVSSIFDYLYVQHYKERERYLKGHEMISSIPSENLIYVMMLEMFEEQDFKGLRVLFEYPLHYLIGDMSELSDEETEYVLNPKTHVDFLIYSNVSKSPLLVVEVDGVAYHKKGTIQSERDKRKNNILDKYNIEYVRLATNGSGEKEIIRSRLKEILGVDK